MAVLAGFLQSKRAILCLALLIGATVLAAMGVFTKDDWISYTQYIVTVWVAGETATKVAEIFGTKKDTSS
jgi:hypothetical protein